MCLYTSSMLLKFDEDFPLPALSRSTTVYWPKRKGCTFGNSKMILSLLTGGGNDIIPFLLSCMMT